MRILQLRYSKSMAAESNQRGQLVSVQFSPKRLASSTHSPGLYSDSWPRDDQKRFPTRLCRSGCDEAHSIAQSAQTIPSHVLKAKQADPENPHHHASR